MLRRELLSSAGLGVLAVALDTGEALADQVTITLLHCNDVYEIAPVAGAGGFAPFMTLLAAERARNPYTITTFGGDLLSPSMLSGLTKGSQMIELTDAIGVQMAVLGNHEFDFGPASSRTNASGPRAIPGSAPMCWPRTGAPAVGSVDLQLLEVGGYKLGFFGVLTPETATLSLARADDQLRRPAGAAAEAASSG